MDSNRSPLISAAQLPAICGQFFLQGWKLIPLLFLVVMIVLPLGAVIFYEDGGWRYALSSNDYLQQRLIWTIYQAGISTFFTLLLGVPIAWVVMRFQFWGRALILRLLMLPFLLPTLIAATGILSLFGAKGFLWAGWQDTPYLLLYGNVFFNLPVMVRSASLGFLQVPASRLKAAQTLGANCWQCFLHVQLPVLLPWLAGGAALIFLYCFSGFGLALLLGGIQYATIEVEIYRLIAHQLDLGQASVLVVQALVINSLAACGYTFLSRRSIFNVVQPIQPRPPQGLAKILPLGAAGILFFASFLPLLAVLWRAALAGSSWQVLLERETQQAICNTFRFTAFALPPALLLSLLHAALARRHLWCRGLIFLPFMVSPVCIAFGVLVIYPQWTASLGLLVATYTLLAYPFITKDILAAWDALPPSYFAAVRSLGASQWQTAVFMVFPLLRPALRRGLTFAAATCLGEFAATLFLSRPEWETLTTRIYHYLSTAGRDNYDRALVLTLLLTILAVIAFLSFDTQSGKHHAAMD